jgi:hypothetical protein
MADASDMSAPVTRRELQDELKQLRQEIKRAVKPLATKVALESWGGALLARIESGERQTHAQFVSLEQRTHAQFVSLEQRLIERADRMQQQLQLDLARHANALHESMVTLICAHDEKYTDLPERVHRLESAVFARKPR